MESGVLNLHFDQNLGMIQTTQHHVTSLIIQIRTLYMK